jgi:hypothetical protein
VSVEHQVVRKGSAVRAVIVVAVGVAVLQRVLGLLLDAAVVGLMVVRHFSMDGSRGVKEGKGLGRTRYRWSAGFKGKRRLMCALTVAHKVGGSRV